MMFMGNISLHVNFAVALLMSYGNFLSKFYHELSLLLAIPIPTDSSENPMDYLMEE